MRPERNAAALSGDGLPTEGWAPIFILGGVLMEPVGSGRPRRFVGDRRSSVTAAIVVWAPLGDPGVWESGDVGCVELLEFNGGAPAQGAVASLPVVEDLQILKDGVG